MRPNVANPKLTRDQMKFLMDRVTLAHANYKLPAIAETKEDKEIAKLTAQLRELQRIVIQREDKRRELMENARTLAREAIYSGTWNEALAVVKHFEKSKF